MTLERQNPSFFLGFEHETLINRMDLIAQIPHYTRCPEGGLEHLSILKDLGFCKHQSPLLTGMDAFQISAAEITLNRFPPN
jgi:hypothetical protein